MFDRVTVLTDGGPAGAQALVVAGRLARTATLPLEAVIAVDDQISDEDDEAFRIQVVHQSPVACLARVRRGRDVVQTLVEALSHRPDALVVMGSRAHGPLGEAVLGSVAEELLVASEHPILFVGPHTAEWDGIGTRLVAAVEDEEGGDLLGPQIAGYVQHFHLRPWLVQVVDPQAWSHRPQFDALESALLDRTASRLTNRHRVDIAWDVLHGHDAADTLVEFAAEHGGGILAVATRRWSDPAHRHWTSIARRLVARSPFPVLVVPVHPALVGA